MKLSSLFALLFAAGAVGNLLKPEPDLPNALIGAGVALSLTLFRIFVTGAGERRSDNFLSWLEENRGALCAGNAVYRGVEVTPATQVRTFLLVTSCLVLTTKTVRGVVVSGVHNAWMPGAGYTLMSLALGWWSLPFGPIYTCQALAVNLAGGRKVTVAELMHGERPISARPVSARAASPSPAPRPRWTPA